MKDMFFDLTKFISVLPTFLLIQQPSSGTKCLIVWFQSAAGPQFRFLKSDIFGVQKMKF